MPITDIVGTRIAALRKTRMLSQSQLAQTAGVDRSFLSEIEHGKANISISILEKIARALNVSMGSLLDGPADATTNNAE